MENTPKNIFILEDGKYKEITNTEHSRRRKNENAYKKRKFIRMGNCLMEVTYENYKKYYKSKEHEEYVEQRDEDHGVILVPEIPEFCKLKIEVNALNEEEQREIQRYIRKVFEVLSYFDKKDQEIIRAIYIEGLTEQQLADRQGVRQQTINKKKKRILNKLRAIMKLLEDE